jgi:hypothetical protein
MEDILIDLMAKKFMSAGVQVSSMRGLQASPLNGCRSGPSQTATKKRRKHRNDMENKNKIPSVLPNYIPHMAGGVRRDNVPRYFEYILITPYLSKGICAVGR